MAGYESLRWAHKRFEGFPEIDIKAVEEAVNKHFEPYIFFRNHKGGRTLYTSCCGLEREWPDDKRIETAADRSVSWGEHNYEAVCPFCGRSVKLKNLSCVGKMKNLAEWHPFFVYTERDGILYSQGFWTRKVYFPKNEVSLTARPEFRTVYSYCYEPGKVTYKEWWYDEWITHIYESGYAARGTASHGKFYDNQKIAMHRVVGADAIERSFLRYCQYERWSHKSIEYGQHWELPQYLVCASVYPRQVEMLVKSGLDCLVTDLVCGYERKRIINWAERDLLKAFDLSREEMKVFLKLGDPYCLEHYKRLRKAGDKTSMQEVSELRGSLDDVRKFITMAKRFKVPARKLRAYLEQFTGQRCHGGYFGLNSAFSLWVDYINMMEYLGRDLKAHNVAFPRELELAHNEAATEQNIKLELEDTDKKKRELARYAASLNERRQKYNFEYGEHFIRIAESQSEIVQEGKTLSHCVGGYAGRHMEGVCTILFLRRKQTPEASLYTIEMRGNQLVQIHGYKNEMKNGVRIAPDPQEVMKEMLDVWLDWLSRGSPRDKQGNPKLRKKKKETNAA